MQELNNVRIATLAVDKYTAVQFYITENKASTSIVATLTIIQPDGTTKTQSKTSSFTIGHGRS